MTGAAQVTVAIVVKDRRDLMARCLAGVGDQQDVAFEIVVVDNHSTDGTYELLCAQAAAATRPFTVLRDPGPVARLRNLALATARTPLVAFTDSDCVPQAGWLTGLLAAVADDVGAVQGRVIPDPDVASARWPWTLEVSTFTSLFETANLLVRREPLIALGGFDERLGFGGEDTAAGWRLVRGGWRGAFASDSIVVHAVTHPGMRRALGRVWRTYRNWPELVRLFPEMRQELMWHPLFLRRRDVALLALGLTPVAVIIIGWVGLVAAVPWLALLRVRNGRWPRPLEFADALAFDAVKLAGLVVGSVEHHTVVL